MERPMAGVRVIDHSDSCLTAPQVRGMGLPAHFQIQEKIMNIRTTNHAPPECLCLYV